MPIWILLLTYNVIYILSKMLCIIVLCNNKLHFYIEWGYNIVTSIISKLNSISQMKVIDLVPIIFFSHHWVINWCLKHTVYDGTVFIIHPKDENKV